MSTPLVVANWKMHGDQAHCARLARQIVRALRREPVSAEIVLAPPFTATERGSSLPQRQPN